MRLLIVEDIFETADMYRKLLENAGYSCDIVDRVSRALVLLSSVEYDLVLLDLNLLDGNGQIVLESIKSSNSKVSVVVISAVNDSTTITRLLNMGADDYLTKPIETDIFVPKINAVLRRKLNRIDNNLEMGIFKIDYTLRNCYINDELIKLSSKEFSILEVLVRYHDTIVSKEIIINNVYDEYYDASSTVLRVHLHNLKKKLNAIYDNEILVTYQKKGYLICLEQFM